MPKIKRVSVGLATVAAIAGLTAIAYWLRGSMKLITATGIAGPGDEQSDHIGLGEWDEFTIS